MTADQAKTGDVLLVQYPQRQTNTPYFWVLTVRTITRGDDNRVTKLAGFAFCKTRGEAGPRTFSADKILSLSPIRKEDDDEEPNAADLSF